MAQSIYGGRIDNEFDQRLLNTFLERLFTTLSFDSEFKLACKVDGHKDIQMPDGIRYLFFFLTRMSRCNFLFKNNNKTQKTTIHQTNLTCISVLCKHLSQAKNYFAILIEEYLNSDLQA